MIGLGLFSSFNKVISGGGYGPIITSAQILSGREVRNTIGSTSLAEGIVCLSALLLYFLMFQVMPKFPLAASLVMGAILSPPVASHSVKKLKVDKMRVLMGTASLTLGELTILKAVF